MLRAGIHQGESVRYCRSELIADTCPKHGAPEFQSVSSCRNRFCPQCNRARGYRLGTSMEERSKELQGTPYFLTLTFRNSPELRDFGYYKNCFTKLRRRRFWKKLCGGLLGGVVAFEVTTPDGEYHPHLHCMIYTKEPVRCYTEGKRAGEWLVEFQQIISDEWLSITGDSFIVNVKGFDGDYRELIKYAVKGVQDMPEEPKYDDVLKKLYAFSRSRRFVQTFGNMYGKVDTEKMDDEPTDTLKCGCESHDVVALSFDDDLDIHVPSRTGKKMMKDGKAFIEWDRLDVPQEAKEFLISNRLTNYHQVRGKPVVRE